METLENEEATIFVPFRNVVVLYLKFRPTSAAAHATAHFLV